MSTPYRPVPAFKAGRGGGAVNRSGAPKSPRGALPQFSPSGPEKPAGSGPKGKGPPPVVGAEKPAPHSTVALGGQLAAQYPIVWRSQGGLAAEIAAVLDAVREGPNATEPSLQKLESVCHNYDLGTEVARFQMRVKEVFAGMTAKLSRDLLRGLFDMTSEAAWWLLEAYSREELRGSEMNSVAVAVPGVEEGEAGEEVEMRRPLADASKKIYWESEEVLKTFEERCIERLETYCSDLATTEDSTAWAGMVGQNCGVQLLRELELGANDPTTRDLGSKVFLSLESTFDQYSGLRQIGDFRGMPDAPFQLSDANQLISRLNELTMVAALQTLENLELVDEYVLSCAFETLCSSLISEYQAFKDGILLRLGYSSSLREMDRSGRNLNHSVVLEYTREVMMVCDTCVEQMTGQFNDRVKQIEFLPPAKQSEVYGSMGGRQELGQRVRAHLFQIKPWARESIQVQTESLMQREVFGKSRDDILNVLNQSKASMLAGFQALVEGRMPEPINRLSEIIAHMDSLLDPILAKKSTGLRRGAKTNKSGRKNKEKRNSPEPSVAFSGMTIRGNMFKDGNNSFAE